MTWQAHGPPRFLAVFCFRSGTQTSSRPWSWRISLTKRPRKCMLLRPGRSRAPRLWEWWSFAVWHTSHCDIPNLAGWFHVYRTPMKKGWFGGCFVIGFTGVDHITFNVKEMLKPWRMDRTSLLCSLNGYKLVNSACHTSVIKAQCCTAPTWSQLCVNPLPNHGFSRVFNANGGRIIIHIPFKVN